jgi:hypothetical protein
MNCICHEPPEKYTIVGLVSALREAEFLMSSLKISRTRIFISALKDYNLLSVVAYAGEQTGCQRTQ